MVLVPEQEFIDQAFWTHPYLQSPGDFDFLWESDPSSFSSQPGNSIGLNVNFPTLGIPSWILGCDRPVLHRQIADPAKLPDVVCDESQAEAAGMSGDEQVVCADHLAMRL